MTRSAELKPPSDTQPSANEGQTQRVREGPGHGPGLRRSAPDELRKIDAYWRACNYLAARA